MESIGQVFLRPELCRILARFYSTLVEADAVEEHIQACCV